MGFYDGRTIIPFNNPVDLLRFPLLSLVDKARLVATLLYCQHMGEAEELHRQPLRPWLTRLGGERAFERVWAPLLRSKFDGGFDGMPATYLWSRMRRMKSTREQGGAVEKLGVLKGGTSHLVDALARKLPEEGVRIHAGAKVQALRDGDRATLVEVEGQAPQPYDLVVSTLPSPLHDQIAAPADGRAMFRMPDRYLGIVDVVVALDHALTPYYTLNLLDASLPFTGIIETTNLMDPEDYGQSHLVYLPRYTDSSGSIYRQSDEEIKQQFVGKLLEMFPTLKPASIQATWLFREPFVEPIHHLGGTFAPFPESLATARPRVYLMNTGRVYPSLHNCQSVVDLARRTADHLLERHA
jgi:protoporphyrinogen oxidase